MISWIWLWTSKYKTGMCDTEHKTNSNVHRNHVGLVLKCRFNSGDLSGTLDLNF